METLITIHSGTKEEIYQEVIPQIQSLIDDEPDLIANLANTASVLKLAFGYISWVGFYLMRDGELVLGPFQGKPACVRISLGKGVCGTSALSMKAVIVPDVNQFPGHIACDPDSQSEIVIPIVAGGKTLGVLDVDSASLNSFDETDRRELERVVSILLPKFGPSKIMV